MEVNWYGIDLNYLPVLISDSVAIAPAVEFTIESGGHVEPAPKKDTSARCTQVEAELSWNLRVSAVRVELTGLDMHTLTRESQEVMVGLIVARLFTN